ncbi:MAG TPA: SH3 domain-containing protein [Candidatus Wallbacteria bacterium]|nr:SH3 domain-containing protein [Candidatus Wallbacteria bacterium]
MIKKLKLAFYIIMAAGTLQAFSSPCLSNVNAVAESIGGETICSDALNDDGSAYLASASGEVSIFPAAGTVINLEKIGLNVRTKPWGAIIGVLANSSKITVTGESGEWYQIDYKGRAAYAYKTYIALGSASASNSEKKENRPLKRIGVPQPESLPEHAANDIKNDGVDSRPENGEIQNKTDETTGSADSTLPETIGAGEGGKSFMAKTESLSRQAREEEIKKAILSGNTPSFLNKFKEIKIKKVLSDGKEHTISYFAAPDYLAVGNDSDFVRTPMNPITAQQIADKLGCMLPTAKMVDDIYAQAATKLSPQPMSSGNYPGWQNRMMKSEFYNEHQRLVQTQISKTAHKNGELVAGHKKDVIVSNSLNSHPDKVIIYGWQLKGGKNIQPLSWIHENTYADYSHGVRLIKRKMIVDGVEMDSADILKDPVLSALLSKEGAVKNISASRK